MANGGWTRRRFLELSALAAVGVGCGSEGGSGAGATGGAGTGGAGTGGAGTGGAGTGGAGTGGAGTGGAGTGGAGTGGAGTGGAGTGGAGGAGGAPASGTSLVGLARASTIGQAVRDAIAFTSGFGFIRSGDTVLFKPNLNSGDPSPYSTSPEVVQAVIELARDHGASRIIVADRSNPSYDTLDAMSRSGITAVGTALGVEMLDLDTVETVRVTPAGATNWPSGFETYRMLLEEVDHVVNLPACKHHSMANFTMSLKAWMGIIVQGDRNTAHASLGQRLPELHLALRESFVVLDATRACLTRGPNPGGEQSSPGIVVASADPIAADATGVAILKDQLTELGISNGDLSAAVWEQPQLQRAMAIGLGIASPSQYVAQASGIDEIERLRAFLAA